jgi:hypothetical protein
VQPQARPVLLLVDGDGDAVEQRMQELLAVLVAGGRRGPDRVQGVAEFKDRCFVGFGERGRAGGPEAGQLGAGVSGCPQRLFPFGFQAAGHQPVLRVDRPAAALGLMAA